MLRHLQTQRGTLLRFHRRVEPECFQNGDGEHVADAHLERHALDDRTPERPLPWEPKTVADADFQQQVQLLSASAATSR